MKAMTEGGADKEARQQWGGDIWVHRRWWQRRRQLVAEININEGSRGGGGGIPIIYVFVS